MSDRSAREPAHAVNEAQVNEAEVGSETQVVESNEATEVIGRLTPPARQEDEQVAAERRELAERIGKSPSLPPGLRSRLVEIAQAGGNVADAVLAFEESLPSVLRGGVSPAVHEHPVGEVFFRGDADAVSDEQAESIARGQLARSGMLRGQRVKVAAD